MAIICAIAGTYVVLRGLSFIGDALAHGVIPGIAIALLFGVPGVVGAAIGAVVMMGGVSTITAKVRLSSDTAIGLLFVGMLALGVIITSRSTSFVGDITRILFGELLGVTAADLGWQIVVLVVVAGIAIVVLGFALRFNPLLVVVGAALATGVLAGFDLVAVIEALGKAFNDNRYISVTWIILPVIGLLERYGLQQRARAVADYIAGMTDRFALREHERLTGRRLL